MSGGATAVFFIGSNFQLTDLLLYSLHNNGVIRMAYVLATISILAFGFAACVALDMIRTRRAARERIARAVRPVHGGPVIRSAPVRAVNRPGEN